MCMCMYVCMYVCTYTYIAVPINENLNKDSRVTVATDVGNGQQKD